MLPVTYKIRKIILLLNQGFLCVKIKKYLVKELKLLFLHSQKNSQTLFKIQFCLFSKND